MSKTYYLRPKDDPQFQNRKGPGGGLLDPDEAVSYFPELALAPCALMPVINGACLLGYCELRFWVRNITASDEPGVYFGEITEEGWPKGIGWFDETYLSLGPDQCIGFEPRHVFEVRA